MARASARRFMKDQAGIRAIGAAVARLPVNPYPPEAFRWGDVLRLRVGPYRVMYTVEGDLITVLRGHDRSAPGHTYSDQELKAAVLHGLHRG